MTTEYGLQYALSLSLLFRRRSSGHLLLGVRSCSFSPLSGNISDSCSEETVAKATHCSACLI